MKLNNRGWGLGAFLGFAIVLIIFILIISINSYRMGLTEKDEIYNNDINNQNVESSNQYNSLKSKILTASMNYKRDYYSDLQSGTTVIVKFKRLQELNYISDLNSCNGYVEIKNENNDIHYNIYLKCPDYISDNYNEENE